ncbi:MAG TPA: 6-carboxytetrahydropterin synthase [Acidimicrobiales bacterium]
MYQVGTAVEVRALHVMQGVEGPEGRLHAHDYKIEVLVGRAELDGRGMVCDLDIIDDALRRLADTVRDVDLEVIRPADAEAVTVEVFARWAHDALTEAVRAGGGEDLTVRVWESPVAFGAYGAPVS